MRRSTGASDPPARPPIGELLIGGGLYGKIRRPEPFRLRVSEFRIRMSSSQRLYRIAFLNQGSVYEIYARSVSHGDLPGFVEIEKLVFGERSTILVDPVEEKLKTEFANVVRTYVPVHAVVRIDQVDRAGAARIMASGGSGKVTVFPGPTPKP